MDARDGRRYLISSTQPSGGAKEARLRDAEDDLSRDTQGRKHPGHHELVEEIQVRTDQRSI
eukprot:SAG11_NODE_459_length_9261_cov_7.747463_11_plen_61_part_00